MSLIYIGPGGFEIVGRVRLTGVLAGIFADNVYWRTCAKCGGLFRQAGLVNPNRRRKNWKCRECIHAS